MKQISEANAQRESEEKLLETLGLRRIHPSRNMKSSREHRQLRIDDNTDETVLEILGLRRIHPSLNIINAKDITTNVKSMKTRSAGKYSKRIQRERKEILLKAKHGTHNLKLIKKNVLRNDSTSSVVGTTHQIKLNDNMYEILITDDAFENVTPQTTSANEGGSGVMDANTEKLKEIDKGAFKKKTLLDEKLTETKPKSSQTQHLKVANKDVFKDETVTIDISAEGELKIDTPNLESTSKESVKSVSPNQVKEKSNLEMKENTMKNDSIKGTNNSDTKSKNDNTKFDHVKEEQKTENNQNQSSNKNHKMSKQKKLEEKQRIAVCRICSKVFAKNSMLKKHHAEIHLSKLPYCCSKCDKRFQELDELIAHTRLHAGKMPYTCKICKASFKTETQFKNHQPVHELAKVPTIKKISCEDCGKAFSKMCDLERHRRVHTGEKPFACMICNKRFQQAHNLTKHLLIHTREKQFQCELCNKIFSRSDVLTRHMFTHSVQKPFVCNFCKKSFNRSAQLNAHVERHHPQKKDLILDKNEEKESNKMNMTIGREK